MGTKREAYIYLIESKASDKFYVGSTINPEKRWKDHKNRLLAGTHTNRHLQAAYNKHGDLTFTVVETCDENVRFQREQDWIDGQSAANPELGYNLSKIAAPTGAPRKRVQPHNLETRLKLSQQKSNKYLPRETVVGIYSMWYEGVTQTNIGKHYGIRQSLVAKILSRKALYANYILDEFLGRLAVVVPKNHYRHFL